MQNNQGIIIKSKKKVNLKNASTGDNFIELTVSKELLAKTVNNQAFNVEADDDVDAEGAKTGNSKIIIKEELINVQAKETEESINNKPEAKRASLQSIYINPNNSSITISSNNTIVEKGHVLIDNQLGDNSQFTYKNELSSGLTNKLEPSNSDYTNENNKELRKKIEEIKNIIETFERLNKNGRFNVSIEEKQKELKELLEQQKNFNQVHISIEKIDRSIVHFESEFNDNASAGTINAQIETPLK